MLELCWKGDIQSWYDPAHAVYRQQPLEWALLRLFPGDLWVWWHRLVFLVSPFCLSTALMGLCHFQPRAGCSPSWGNAWTAWAWVQREMQSLFTHLPHQGSLRHHKIGVAESCFVLDFVVDNWHEKGLTNPSFPSVCTRLKWKYDVFRSSLRLLN